MINSIYAILYGLFAILLMITALIWSFAIVLAPIHYLITNILGF